VGRKDYWIGFAFFLGLAACVVVLFTAPDGETLFHHLLGVFGIAPGIPFGATGRLYIFMLVPLVGVVFCFVKMCEYWGDLRTLLSPLLLIVIIVVWLATSAIQPSVIDRVYFSVISRRNDVRAVTVTAQDSLNFEYRGNYRRIFYDFQLNNHSEESLSFNVKLALDNWNGLEEILVADESGEPKIFTLPPRSMRTFVGEFSTGLDDYITGGGRIAFTIILVSDTVQHQPPNLVRRPVFCTLGN